MDGTRYCRQLCLARKVQAVANVSRAPVSPYHNFERHTKAKERRGNSIKEIMLTGYDYDSRLAKKKWKGRYYPVIR